MALCLFRVTVRTCNNKLPVPTKRATVLIKVKSWSALLHMLIVCIVSFPKSVLRYKYLILDTYHPATLYVHEQGDEDPSLFFEAKRGTRAKKFGKHCYVTMVAQRRSRFRR